MSKSKKFHTLVSQTLKNSTKAPQDKGCIICRYNGLDIRVGPNSLDRALGIMDKLIKTLEEKKAQVSIIKKEYKYITYAEISGVKLEIDIYEKLNIIKKGQDRFGFNRYDYIPNGKLVLRIKNAPYGVRKEWIDSQNKKAEDRIGDFIEGLYKSVTREKELQKEREKWREGQYKKDELQKLKDIETQRINDLEKEAFSWQKGQIIKSYVEAATKAYIEKNGKIEPGSEFDKWKTWAIKCIKQTDSMNLLAQNKIKMG